MLQMTGIPKPSVFGADLASLASLAAIALDNLSLGHGGDLTPVEVLAERMDASQVRMDLTTAAAVQRALIEIPDAPKSTTVDELVSNASDFVQRLSNVVAHRDAPDIEEARQLRAFCVVLSRTAIALAGPLQVRLPHPFRS